MSRTFRRFARPIFTRRRDRHDPPLHEQLVTTNTLDTRAPSPREMPPPLNTLGSGDSPPRGPLLSVGMVDSDGPSPTEPLPPLDIASVDDPPALRRSPPPGTLSTDDQPSRELSSPSNALNRDGRLPRQLSPSRRFQFDDLWLSALEEYRKTVGTDLLDPKEPVMLELENCQSEDSVIDAIEGAARRLGKKREGNSASRKLRQVLQPIVHGLRVILDASAETASSLRVPGGKGIFAAVAILLKAAEDVSATFDNIQHLLERLLAHVEWLQVRIRVPLRREAREIAVEALVQILKTLALITATLHKNRLELFLKALFTKNDGFADLERTLQDLISDQDRMTNADILLDVHQISCDVRNTHGTIAHVDEVMMDVHGTTSAHLAEARENEKRQMEAERQQRERYDIIVNRLDILVGRRQLAPEDMDTPADTSHHSAGWTIFATLLGAWTALSCSLRTIGDHSDAAAQTVITVSSDPINGAWVTTYHFFFLYVLWEYSVPRLPGWADGVVIVVDVLGSSHQLNHERFATRENTHAYLVQVFRGRPGASYVDQESYGLGDEAHPLITSKEWLDIVRPGSVLNMSIIVSAPAPQCPYCKTGTSGGETSLGDGRVICSGCGRCFMCQLNSDTSTAATSETGQTHDVVSDSSDPSSPQTSNTAGESTLPHQGAQPVSLALFIRIIVQYLEQFTSDSAQREQYSSESSTSDDAQGFDTDPEYDSDDGIDEWLDMRSRGSGANSQPEPDTYHMNESDNLRTQKLDGRGVQDVNSETGSKSEKNPRTGDTGAGSPPESAENLQSARPRTSSPPYDDTIDYVMKLHNYLGYTRQHNDFHWKTSNDGPVDYPRWYVTAILNGAVIGQGQSTAKGPAKRHAAFEALKFLGQL